MKDDFFIKKNILLYYEDVVAFWIIFVNFQHNIIKIQKNILFILNKKI